MLHVLILAAGKGTRMGGDYPKVLAEVRGRSMVERLLLGIRPACSKPTIVVGYKGEEVIARLGNEYEYVWQKEQLGTGHAVASAKEVLEPLPISTLVVLYGDHPLVTEKTVESLAALRETSGAAIAMGTVTVPNYEGEFKIFSNWGRIVRSEEGAVLRIVESKDASREELNIREHSPSYFAFDPRWLWASLPKIRNQNAKGEYYLTDLVGFTIAEGRKVVTVPVRPEEAMGANTPEELEIVEKGIAIRKFEK